jgi:chromosome segregation ATPase
MSTSKRNVIVLAAMIAILPVRFCRAIDTTGLVGEFSLPDRLRNLIDSQDEYFRAVQRMQDGEAAVMRAREAAMKDAQSADDYVAAVKAVDQAYQGYMEKKNAAIGKLEKTNQIYSGMKSHVAQIDSQIEAARQNPATTQDQFEQLYKDRETFLHQCQQAESDAIDRQGLAPLRQAWIDASKKVSDMQEKQRAAIESNDRLKAALAEAAAAKAAVQEARAAINGGSTAGDANSVEQSRAADLLYRSSHASFAGNDAWLTYGWTNLTDASGSKPAGASASAADGKK